MKVLSKDIKEFWKELAIIQLICVNQDAVWFLS